MNTREISLILVVHRHDDNLFGKITAVQNYISKKSRQFSFVGFSIDNSNHAFEQGFANSYTNIQSHNSTYNVLLRMDDHSCLFETVEKFKKICKMFSIDADIEIQEIMINMM